MPSISNFVSAINESEATLKTLHHAEIIRDKQGLPYMSVGNVGVVFKVRIEGKLFALKCYTKPNPRLKTIYSHYDTTGILPQTQWLEKELYLCHNGGGEWHDVGLCEWMEGKTLQEVIERTIIERDRNKFKELYNEFIRLSSSLLHAEWAHGDLKPDNIIITPHGSMRLIDIDAIFLPSIPYTHTNEVGTPYYQHPFRDNNTYDCHIDDYPIALIATTLAALNLDLDLSHRAGHDIGNLIIPSQAVEGDSCELAEIEELFARHGKGAELQVARLLRPNDYELYALSQWIKCASKEDGDNRAARIPTPLNCLGRFSDPYSRWVVPTVLS